MKKNRQGKILELVTQFNIGTQDELISLLRQEGYDATQATVSRDIRALKLLKVQTDDGSYRYLPIQHDNGAKEDKSGGEEQAAQWRAYASAIRSVEYALNNVVIRTSPGLASAIAGVLDRVNHDMMLGCVAGDDTVIVVTHTMDESNRLTESIRAQMK